VAFACVSGLLTVAAIVITTWIHRLATTVIDADGVHTHPLFNQRNHSWQDVAWIGPSPAATSRYGRLRLRRGRSVGLLGVDHTTATQLGQRLHSWRHDQGRPPHQH
jgi:hypothetical protein